MRRHRFYVAATICGVVAATACSALVSLDDVQCNVDADCASSLSNGVCVDQVCEKSTTAGDSGVDSGAEASASDASDSGTIDSARDPWRCVGDPPAVLVPIPQISLTVFAFDPLQAITTNGINGGSDLDILSATGISDVAMRPCNLLDTNCNSPLASTQTTDDSGAATFSVPGNFDGYFQITHDGNFPSTFFPGNPLPDASAQFVPLPLLSIEGAQGLAETLGVPFITDPDSGLGLAFFLVYDCDDEHGEGVSFSVGDAGADASVFWYTNMGYPSATATLTDSLGSAGVINFPEGIFSVTATQADSGRELAKATAVIRAGGATIVLIRARHPLNGPRAPRRP